jgi:hypothetical protein
MRNATSQPNAALLPGRGLTSAVHLQNGVNLPRESREASPPFWQVQPLVSRQQPGHGRKPRRTHDGEAVTTEPAAATFRQPQQLAAPEATWRDATSDTDRDSTAGPRSSLRRRMERRLRPINQDASAPFIIPFTTSRTRARLHHRAIAERTNRPAPHCVEPRNCSVARPRVTRRREAREPVVAHQSPRGEDHAEQALREPGHETGVNKPFQSTIPLPPLHG